VVCPKCHTEINNNNIECPSCGVIFSKLQNSQESKGVEERASLESNQPKLNAIPVNNIQIISESEFNLLEFVNKIPRPIIFVVFALVAYFGVKHYFSLDSVNAPELLAEGNELEEYLNFNYRYVERVYGPSPNDAPRPLIVVLHGSGANENDLLDLFKKVAFDLRVISYQAPIKKGFGYRWSYAYGKTNEEIQKKNFIILKSVAEGLANNIDHLGDKYPLKGKPMVLGFSRGAELTYYFAAYHRDKFSALFPLSGVLKPNLRFKEPEGYSTAPVFAYHGTQDSILSVESARDVVSWLKKHSVNIDLKVDDYSHQIPRYVINDFIQKIQIEIQKM